MITNPSYVAKLYLTKWRSSLRSAKHFSDGTLTDHGKLNYTGALELKDIQDHSSESNRGFNVSTSVGTSIKGESKESSLHPSGSTTVGLQSTGNEKEQLTKATMGQGSVTNTTTTSNRDINNTQEITRDQVTGLLNGSVTVDNRLLTESGRAQIIQQQKDLPQNAEIIGKMTAAGVTSLGVATASLASGDQNLKQAYDTVMNPARTFDFVQKHPEAATVLEQFKNGDYDGLLATKGSIQLLAQALGQDVNVLTTSITSFLNIKGAYDHQTDTVVLDVNNENRSSILNTTGHEIAHGQGIKNETSADLVGKSVDWAFNSGVKNNQDTIDQFKGQLGDGKDASTQLKNNEILTNDNHKVIDSIADHSDVIDEKTTLNQDKDLIIALAGCAKNFSLDCASSKYTDYKTLDGIQSLAYQRGYDKAVDQMIADAKNLPKNVREALILIKDDPKAFGAAMLQALKDMPAEYQDKVKKVLAAKYNAKTPAEFEAAGKAELELKVEMGSFMLGGVGAVKTGAKVGAEIAEKISAKTAEKAEKAAAKIENNFHRDDELLSNKPSGKREIASGLVGTDFEKWLKSQYGGSGSFSKGGREFDGSIGNTNRWYEAKSGNYWKDQTQTPSKLSKFKSDMGARKKIAESNGATYELHSNTPIPQNVKQWLTEKGIPFYEHQ